MCVIMAGVPLILMPAKADAADVERLHALLRDATSHGYGRIVVDMTRVRSCSPAVVHILLRAHMRASSEGRELRLVLPADEGVSAALRLPCIDRFISCFHSLAQAVGPQYRIASA